MTQEVSQNSGSSQVPSQYLQKKKEILNLAPNNQILRNMFGKLKSQSLNTAYESSLLFKNNDHSLQSLKSVKRMIGYGNGSGKSKKLNNHNHFNQFHLQRILQFQIKQKDQTSTIESPLKLQNKHNKIQECQKKQILSGKQIADNQFSRVYTNLTTKIQGQFHTKHEINQQGQIKNSSIFPYSPNSNTFNLPEINLKNSSTKNQYSDLNNIFKTESVKLKSKKQLNFNIIYIKKSRKAKNGQIEQKQTDKDNNMQNAKNFATLDPIINSQQSKNTNNMNKQFLDNLSTGYSKYRIQRQPANYNEYLEMEIQKNKRIQKLNLFRKQNQKRITNQLLHQKKLDLLKENYQKLNIDQLNPQNYRQILQRKEVISVTTSARLNKDQQKQTSKRISLIKQASLRKMPQIAPLNQIQLESQVVPLQKFMKGYMNYHPQGKQFYEQNKSNLSNQIRLNNILFAPLGLTAKSYAVFDLQTLTPISYKKYKDSIQIASISKVMTCYLSLLICKKYQINYKTYTVKITEKASQMVGTSAQLQRGDIVTIQQLLYGLMLPSGNDASVALAEALGKIIQKYKKKQTKKTFYQTFIAHMNVLSRQLQLDQQWKNSSGLPSNPNICTSQSICLLTSIAMKDDKFKQIVNTKIYETEIKNQMFGLTRKICWKNTNRLLNDGWQGVKTGTTQSAGHCLLSKKQKYLIAVYDCQSLSKRFTQCEALYNLIKKYEHSF